MKVTIIIPTYNEQGVIGDCLASLNKQTFKNFEVIIVDDGSTDGTLEVSRDLKLKYKLLTLHQNHKGAGSARNMGVKKADGNILVFVDADMTFDKNFVKKLVDPIIKGKSRGTFSKEEFVSNWDNVWARCWNINEGWQKMRRHPKKYPSKQKVFRAILKSEFESVKGFDSKYGYADDWSLSDKLGYLATSASGAKFYHKNPDNLKEIYNHATWVSKRPYKLGKLGSVIALIRSSLPISLVVGLIKSVLSLQPAFLIFKVVYDFGAFIGIIEYISTGKVSK